MLQEMHSIVTIALEIHRTFLTGASNGIIVIDPEQDFHRAWAEPIQAHRYHYWRARNNCPGFMDRYPPGCVGDRQYNCRHFVYRGFYRLPAYHCPRSIYD